MGRPAARAAALMPDHGAQPRLYDFRVSKSAAEGAQAAGTAACAEGSPGKLRAERAVLATPTRGPAEAAVLKP